MKEANSLHKLEDFKRLLDGYRPSTKSLDILNRTSLVLLVGPTAAGRNTLIKLLLDTNRYHYIVSNTTRKPRENNGIMETNGVEYWFTSEDDFLNGLKNGAYLEAAVIHNQQVSGISIAELEKAWASGKIAIDEIEVEGAKNIYAYKPDALFVFLLPPSFEIWMKRLHGRGHMDADELTRRLTSAHEEVSMALSADYYNFVVNDDIHDATMAVDELANGRTPDGDKQRHGRDHAEQLLINIQLYLKGK